MHVLGFVQAFHRCFGVDDFLGAWQRGEVLQRGTLDDQYEGGQKCELQVFSVID